MKSSLGAYMQQEINASSSLVLLEEDYWYTALVACGTNTGKGLANLSCAFTYRDIRLTSGIVASDTAMGQHLDVHTCGCIRAKVEVTVLGCNL